MARPAGRALFASLTEPPADPELGKPGLGHSVTIPRARRGTPRRRQSVPRAAFGVAMLTLLRLPC